MLQADELQRRLALLLPNDFQEQHLQPLLSAIFQAPPESPVGVAENEMFSLRYGAQGGSGAFEASAGLAQHWLACYPIFQTVLASRFLQRTDCLAKVRKITQPSSQACLDTATPGTAASQQPAAPSEA
ncbi:unnamed protein product [Effrenium voratum]|uniref:Uncharacterized protein n=1 Tax=Effrenium voratum TaxID=2562239 RepID=A0AA36NK49_9DINO|nr:unnamed protein product [Effrenium voratum]CAJ1426548.1 unnamed protein product [Effrenium voratum]CAJ1429832.1 unnamed protein product [Effrenium voratum]